MSKTSTNIFTEFILRLSLCHHIAKSSNAKKNTANKIYIALPFSFMVQDVTSKVIMQ